MIRYECKKTWKDAFSGEEKFIKFFLSVVEDKKENKYRILNSTSGTIWANAYKTEEDARNAILMDSGFEIISERDPNKDNFHSWSIAHEYDIPRDCYSYIQYCPSISWAKAQELYRTAVDHVKFEKKVKNLVDLPFGQGLVMAKHIFKAKLINLNKAI